ncbi:UDP-N-acetylmuramate dehydrogenase [Arachidicoccus soli]|uniref:UDP-N-acetylenolpyruvoylglucosamine reductase n=1 Tax=Arachidicoccus soli TaxID=2341117 RepID=A0A386HMN3_9BACT|nr:UDP-N-acetylmuramate dehydrogenase [Arachidicoccus soli]AYD47003.1 UDP-N-acetylmuramate dehydrogenase [Arachidicoccus soli]
MIIAENISLKPYNTFGINVSANQFAEFNSLESLKKLLKNEEKHLIIGGGSNILFTKNFDGIVLKNGLKGIHLLREDDDFIYIQAAGGEQWHQFVLYCVERNYSGVENLSLIPGCVGAAPMQNIGAYGIELKDVFYQLEALHIPSSAICTFNKEECKFGYRESVFKKEFKNQYVILNVTFRLKRLPDFHIEYGAIKAELEKMKISNLSIQAISQAVINIRESKLPNPKEIGNAGSFFKNPTISETSFVSLKDKFPQIVAYDLPDTKQKKIAAGWLIEQCGWKGFKQDNYGVHAKQALVLVNYGDANGADILKLSEQIIESVNEKFSIHLEREVNIV